MKKNVLQEKSYQFALNIIQVGYALMEKKEYILSKQLIRSGTSIGANVEEGIGGHSEKDFHYKMNLAYKEARETKYWLRLLRDSNHLQEKSAEECINDVEEILKILGSILITIQKKQSLS